MKYKSVVVLTGAGVSAESGIKTFRASDGLWEEHRIEDVASPEGYARNPELVLDFYNQRRRQLVSDAIRENEAHLALAKLEQGLLEQGGKFLLVTQNIDDLHERAGSQSLLHMHGELLKLRCESCGALSACVEDSSKQDVCNACGAVGSLRPHIVWFGEMPLAMDEIYDALEQCDLFVAIGTSGHVYPAAGFVEVANKSGAETIEINLEVSAVTSHFDSQILGAASVAVPNFVEFLLQS
jgi:NAD-dependent protein deacetylase/lipoamidase